MITVGTVRLGAPHTDPSAANANAHWTPDIARSALVAQNVDVKTAEYVSGLSQRSQSIAPQCAARLPHVGMYAPRVTCRRMVARRSIGEWLPQ